jgi:serine/threonine-protein kinase
MSTANTLTSGLDCTSPESIMEPTTRTPAGDQYSLGCVLYFSLTGRVPFPEGSAVEKMMAHQTKEPVPISELAPEVPAGLDVVVQRLMAKTPEGRFSGCDELVEALEPFLGDLNNIPGGSPNTRSGSRPGLGGRSSGSMPGLAARTNPATKVTLPSKSIPSPTERQRPNPTPAAPDRARPGPAAAPAPNVRTPQPGRSPSTIPSRASFQLPGVNGEDEGVPVSAPVEPARAPLPKLPTRGAPTAAAARGAVQAPTKSPLPEIEAEGEPEPTAWADDAETERKSAFGPVGIVAAALLLMAAVYYGATLLMK